MNKVITSFAHGKDFEQMLSVTIPTFYNYATKHGYDLIIPSKNKIIDICNTYGWDHNRPVSWLKVPIVRYLLKIYDVVLWLDSDIVIYNFNKDIAQFIKEDTIQAFTIHQDLYEGRVPNCGVWLLTKSADELLNDIWNKENYINHKWWEQGANIDCMNWQPRSRYQNLTYYGLSSVELPFEFNIHKNDIRFKEDSYLENGVFLHATMWANRQEKMKEWVKDAKLD